MNAIDTIANICEHDSLLSSSLKYCLVDINKHPIKANGEPARPNHIEDFVELSALLQCKDLQNYAGVGISVQASDICAIDIDHCFGRKFDISSLDERGKKIVKLFSKCAYIEFSFSGTGLRILFKHKILEDYTETYYIKNDKLGIEFYQPSGSYRYVTITGKTIFDNNIANVDDRLLIDFLDEFMTRPIFYHQTSTNSSDDRDIDTLMKLTKALYLKNFVFQDLWFMSEQEHILKLSCNIQGKSRESHADFQILSLLFENITQDKEKLRLVFEQSPYFKSKDYKHQQKWLKQNYRYYDYQYNNIKALHSKCN